MPEKEEHKVVLDRHRKLEELRVLGIEPYPYRFLPVDRSADIAQRFAHLKPGERTTVLFRLAGRIMALRRMGRASFGDLQDASGRLQFYIHEDADPEQYRLFELIDLGDIIGIEGAVFKTKSGELTIDVDKLSLLAKALRPLPDKWKGLRDPELRYRRRYLDLLMGPAKREIFVKKAAIIQTLRSFLNSRGFLEVESPVLQPIYGGAQARPFKTHLNALDMDVFLRISNELYLKRLIVGGYDKVYEIGYDFRNESIDRTHNPEFTVMECYWAYADYNDMASLFEKLMAKLAIAATGSTKIDWQKKSADLKKWQRLTVYEALKKFTNIDVAALDEKALVSLIRKHKIELHEPKSTRGTMINALFEELVVPKLIEPTIIFDHPKETTPLAKQHRRHPELVERFEPFLFGLELGNAYSELNDPVLQRAKLEEQAKLLRGGYTEAHPMDEEFVRALEYGMPPTAGLGLGVDRLIMLLTNQPSIKDVIFFPFMRPGHA